LLPAAHCQLVYCLYYFIDHLGYREVFRVDTDMGLAIDLFPMSQKLLDPLQSIVAL
jgi:hypothetical protein